jgi:hypothetical protein
MNAKTILWAVGAFGAAGLLFLMGRKGSAPGAATAAAGAAQLAAGSQHWYSSNAEQTAAVDKAVQQNWRDTFALMDQTQPDWWV